MKKLPPQKRKPGTTRSHAIQLARCAGWTQWALPLLAREIDRTEAAILDSATTAPKKQMRDLGAKRDALRGYLSLLHAEASASRPAGEIIPPNTDDTDEAPVDVIAAAFTLPKSQGANAAPTKTPPPPPAPAWDPFSWDPFAGPIQKGKPHDETQDPAP